MSNVIGRFYLMDNKMVDYKIFYTKVCDVDCYPRVREGVPSEEMIKKNLKRFERWLAGVQGFFRIDNEGWICSTGQYDISHLELGSMQLNMVCDKIKAERYGKMKSLEGLIAEYVRYVTAVELCKEGEDEKQD